jgi:hypothetical protein
MQVLVDGSFDVWNEVKTRTARLEVLTVAIIAFHQLELVRNIFHLIPKPTVVFIVHIRVFHCFYEAVVRQKKEYAILNRSYLIVRSFLDDEIEV